KIAEKSVAEKAGFMAGDEIVMVNGRDVNYWNDFVDIIRSSPNKAMNITVKRGNDFKRLSLTVPEEAAIGVQLDSKDLMVTDEYSFLEAIPAGFNKTN